MFNLSSLLLDNALLKYVVIEVLFKLLLKDIDFSKGSVATHLRFDGIFSDSIIKKISPYSHSEKFKNWSVFDYVIRRTKSVPILGAPCTFGTGSYLAVAY